MDILEDYCCRAQQEVQSAYWNTCQVTLHPAVVYYKGGEEVKHKSYVLVSPESRDDPKFVYTVLKELASCLKDLGHQVNYVHYWTDSSMSQYRNTHTHTHTHTHFQGKIFM